MSIHMGLLSLILVVAQLVVVVAAKNVGFQASILQCHLQKILNLECLLKPQNRLEIPKWLSLLA